MSARLHRRCIAWRETDDRQDDDVFWRAFVFFRASFLTRQPEASVVVVVVHRFHLVQIPTLQITTLTSAQRLLLHSILSQ
jgi:hypothetical protein